MQLSEKDLVLTTEEATEYLRISKPTFLKYIRLGRMKLPAASGGVSSGIPPKQTRLRSMSFGAVRLAIHPCGKPQGILAKANKGDQSRKGLESTPI